MKRRKLHGKKINSINMSSRKAKGRDFQKEIAQMISDLTGFPAGKDCPIESRPMGQHGPDIRMESHVRKIFPYTVECKRCENWNVPGWIKQAKSNQMKDTDWLLFIRRTNEEPVVVMNAVRFFLLLERAKP